jgi:hypothetical protein
MEPRMEFRSTSFVIRFGALRFPVAISGPAAMALSRIFSGIFRPGMGEVIPGAELRRLGSQLPVVEGRGRSDSQDDGQSGDSYRRCRPSHIRQSDE